MPSIRSCRHRRRPTAPNDMSILRRIIVMALWGSLLGGLTPASTPWNRICVADAFPTIQSFSRVATTSTSVLRTAAVPRRRQPSSSSISMSYLMDPQKNPSLSSGKQQQQPDFVMRNGKHQPGNGSWQRRLRTTSSNRRNGNPAMGDIAFLRKRTTDLLRVTDSSSSNNQKNQSENAGDSNSNEDNAPTIGGNMKVDRKTFHFLMDAWAFSGELDAADQALALLERMEELSSAPTASHSSSALRPDVRSYTKVINAISRSSRADAGELAESVLETMEFLSSSKQNESCRPNTYTYTAVIEAHANSGAPGSAQKAMKWCEVMVQKYNQNKEMQDSSSHGNVAEDGQDDAAALVKPTARCFHAAMNAHAKSGEEDAAEQAGWVLDRMEEVYRDTGLPDMKPNAYHYNTLIAAWAKSGSAQRAHGVLTRMEKAVLETATGSSTSTQNHYGADEDKQDSEPVKPTTVTYNAVIDAYAKSGEDDAAEKAEALLHRMKRLYETKENVQVRPNVRSFNSVINAWAKSRQPNAAIKAEELLDRMQKQLRSQGVEEVRPDVHSFCTVINAWARSPNHGKAERALNLLKDLKKSYDDATTDPGQKTHLCPNIVAYNAVMNACAYTVGDNMKEQNRAVEIAHSVLKELETKRPYGISPDQVTYGTFLKVCENQMPDCSTRQQIVEVLFKKCCKEGQVGNLVLQQLKTMASDELHRKLLLKGIDQDVQMQDLPQEWWCNVVEGKWQRRRRNYAPGAASPPSSSSSSSSS